MKVTTGLLVLRNMEATFIPVDGKIRKVTPANGKTFNVQELQSFVGGYIEIIPTAAKVSAMMVINERGKLEKLPVNVIASSVWSEVVGEADYIAGPALLCHR
jgi:hypothetical protein